MPEKLARSVVVTPCCRHHSLTERPLLRHSWICAAHSCSSARCFNSALVILTPHNTTVAKRFATFRYYCLMCVYARLGLTVTVFRTFCMKMPGRKLDGVPLCLLNFDSKHWGTPSNKNRAAVYIASYPHN